MEATVKNLLALLGVILFACPAFAGDNSVSQILIDLFRQKDTTGYGGQRQKYVPAWAMNTDGTNCVDPAMTELITSGPKEGAIICGDVANAEIDFSYGMPDNWDAGDVIIEVEAHRATGSGTLEFDIVMQCRGDGEALAAWGTAGTSDDVTITWSTANAGEKAVSPAITPTGTCAAGDHLYVRLEVATTATTVADANVLGARILFTVDELDEDN
jgi:hypothetical protein